jgi:hypothetical protein
MENFEAIAATVRVSQDLTWENLNEGNAALRADLEVLACLLERAAPGAARRKDRKGHRSGPAKGGDDKAAALKYFGFSSKHPPSSKEQLRSAWAKKVMSIHPDHHPGADEGEVKRFNEESNRCTQFYNELLTRFGWH